MVTIIGFSLGLIMGGIMGWLIASLKAKTREVLNNELRQQIQHRDSERDKLNEELVAERQARVEAITRLEESQKRFEEEKDLIEAMKKEMADTFNALSSAALKSSSEDFLKLASLHLEKIIADTKGRLGEHQAAIDGLIKPLQDALKRSEEQINNIEAKRRQDYGGLQEQIKLLGLTHQQLQKETSNLVTALRKPQVSGSWGQLSLRRTAELAGMTAYCDFYEQVLVSTERGHLRPDMVVKLPNGREIVVDAKAPVDVYLNAISASQEEERKKGIAQYVNQVRMHINNLSSKSYWEQFPNSPEMVVMYLPGESFFSAAVEYDHKLIEESSIKKVILATPTTSIALLKAIACGWQEKEMAKNAERISMLGKELYERISTLAKHFDDMGSAIKRAMDAYNKVIGSMEAKVLPSVRKFRELGVKVAGEIPPFEEIDHLPRRLISGPE
ncbi:MAG: DNA recombination protein RmuC [bacterium]